MLQFAQLLLELNQSKKALVREAALWRYFERANEDDKIWALALLTKFRLAKVASMSDLKEWAMEVAEIPEWLFHQSLGHVDDLGETIANVLGIPANYEENSLLHWISFIKELKEQEAGEKQISILDAWNRMKPTERFLFNKLISGTWRINLPLQLIAKALARHTDKSEQELIYILNGDWHPDQISFSELLNSSNAKEDTSKSLPFLDPKALDHEVDSLGSPKQWMALRMWDGIRAQLLVREGELLIWSLAGDLLSPKLPEFQDLIQSLPNGTAIDGHLMAFEDGLPQHIQQLEKRLARKRITPKLIKEIPIVFVAHDLLELEAKDIRELPFSRRFNHLTQLIESLQATPLLLSDQIPFKSWGNLEDPLQASRKFHAKGILLKKIDSLYQSGANNPPWLLWKSPPLHIKAVLIYKSRETGQSNQDLYTFAVWKAEELIPITKANGDLSKEEVKEIELFVRANTIERFGPVRSVKAELVFEIEFDEIIAYSRSKSGFKLINPRIRNWLKETAPKSANSISELAKLLANYEA